VTGIILFASQTSSVAAVVLFVLGTAVCVGLLIRFALWRIVHAKPPYSIYSDQSQEGYLASTYDHSAIGKTGLVVADLKPGGYIVIEGRQHPAISLEGYMAKGEHVIVVSGQEQSLIVKLSQKE
jgi:membrane-bound serine protease (ClpP class)